ncbi:MAG: relaxase/mobilization nuclease domain-containing protein, partial [Oscillospiraceae bacterium]
MATTSLWPISGRLKGLIDYVENPLKTIEQNDELKDLFHVFEYTTMDKKTASKQYVSGVNCLPEIALNQMIITKKQYSKTDKRIAYHGFQSFLPGEVNADTAHEIGKKFAQQMWGDRFQVVVTTHLYKEHMHNHFCVNSVSFLDGKKYNFSKKERLRMIELSDNLCREYGLSVVENPSKPPTPRNIYLDEKEGKPTQYSLMRLAVNEALKNAYTFEQLKTYLSDYGYEIDFRSKYPGIKLSNHKYFTRFTTLDKQWSVDFLKDRMKYNAGIQKRYIPFSPPQIPYEIKREWQYKKATGIRALYLYYCYQLGVLPKETNYKPHHPALLEDLKKLDIISKQTMIICRNKLDTMDDLEN